MKFYFGSVLYQQCRIFCGYNLWFFIFLPYLSCCTVMSYAINFSVCYTIRLFRECKSHMLLSNILWLPEIRNLIVYLTSPTSGNSKPGMSVSSLTYHALSKLTIYFTYLCNYRYQIKTMFINCHEDRNDVFDKYIIFQENRHCVYIKLNGTLYMYNSTLLSKRIIST